MTTSRTLRLLVAVLATLALLAAGCGSSDSTASTDGSTEASTEGGESDGESDEGGTADGDAADGDASDSGGEDDETSSTTAMAEEADVDMSDAAEVTVLDAGAEPRTELRIQVEPGQSETMIVGQVQEVSQTIAGQAGPDLGEIAIVIEQEITASSAGGDLLTYTSLITSATVDEGTNPLVATELQTALDGMVGISTTSIVDDRGRVLDAEVDGLAALDPTAASTVQQMTTNSQFSHPLPEEAVGVGATWQVAQLIPVNGIDVEQVTSYEVLSIDGTVVELALAAEQFVEAGDQLEAGGATATVLLWEGITSASITLDLTAMVPSSTAQLFANQELELGPGAEKTVLEQSIQTTITISRG